ncbi:OmpA family protein [Erwinia sp. CPCC 100877]|nr:OmpA family protein [Erwinia sp. CPCC 100877]
MGVFNLCKLDGVTVIKFCLSRIVVVLFVSCFFSSSNIYARESKLTSPWLMDLTPGKEQWITDDTKARIIVFRLTREQDEFADKPLNIFLDGAYHASLLPGHQAVAISLCPGRERINAVFGKIANTETLLQYADETPELKAGLIYFYQVAVDNQGKALARWVDSEQAKQVLANVKIQNHTISRVMENQKCPTGIYKIRSSTLFKINQYERDGMLSDSERILQQLAEKIATDYQSLDKIIVKGYTDPLGNFQYNKTLSEKRAKTIKEILEASDLPDDIITSQGMGASHLIVSDCNERHLNWRQIVQCNQPNRRVEIEVYGLKRKNEG